MNGFTAARSVSNTKAVAARLRATGKRATFDRDALSKIGRYNRSLFRKRFKNRGATRSNSPWKPIEENSREGAGIWGLSYPLVDSGKLYRSWTVKGAKGNISRIDKHSASFGSRYRNAKGANLAHLHEFGYRKVVTGRVPARPVVSIGKYARENMAEIMLDHIMAYYRLPTVKVEE